MKIYVDISNDLSSGIWRDTHFFQSIGYPLLLSKLRTTIANFSLGMNIIQALASGLTLILFYKLASESLGKRVGLVSLLIGVFHWPWILLNNYALPESLFTCLLAITGWLSWKIVSLEKPHKIYGVLWGLSFICAFWLKGTHAFWGPLFLVTLFFGKKVKPINLMMAICLTVSAGLFLHGLLAQKTIGRFQLSSSTGGLNFIEGKCPDKVNSDGSYIWHSPLYYQLGLKSEKRWSVPFTHSSYYFKQGFKCIQKNPLVLIQSFESIPFLFMGNTIWPLNSSKHSQLIRLYELFFAVFMISGLVAFAIHSFKAPIKFNEFATWVIPILAIFTCVYIFKAEMRYRVPYDIWLIPVSVKGWFGLLANNKR